MKAEMESGRVLEAKSAHRLLKGYIQATAAMFAVIGLLMLLIVLDDIPPLRQKDALFRLTTRTVLVLAGVLHLSVSGYLAVVRDLMNQGIATLSASCYYIIYGVGMAWVMNVAAPFPAVVALAWKFGISSKMADTLCILFIVYLVLGSLLTMILEWGRLKQFDAEALLKRWGEVHAHKAAKGDSHLRNATKADVVAKSLPEFKFSCPNCGQHIRCDEAYSGRQINCPSCKNRIGVPPINARRSEC